MQGLDDTRIKVERKHFINFLRSGRKHCLTLNHNRIYSFLFFNATKNNQFKGKS